MHQRLGVLAAVVFLLAGCASIPYGAEGHGQPREAQQTPPNIIIFYADDLGYGDVSRYGATAIQTPNVDRLAEHGLLLTDAHATSATCTPSRYSLLTGEYGFRSRANILPGDAPALIRPGKPTLPSMLQDNGYTTAVIGKWHLGLGDDDLDWNASISPGPLDIGFDTAFLIPATGDRVPTVYVENDRVVGVEQDDPIFVDYADRIGERPIGNDRPDLLRVGADEQHGKTIINGVSRIGYMAGGQNAEWVDEDFPMVFTDKAKAFIRANQDGPFFLFFPFHDPHVPRLPHPRFQGATELGPRGDAIVQMDWMTGAVMEEIEALGLTEQTLVFFTSDNGPVLFDGYDDNAVERNGDHLPGGPFRGGKYSALEAGARVPTIVSWPGQVTPGTSPALLSQVDLYASLAELVGHPLESDVAIDSLALIDAWLGEDTHGRDILFKETPATSALRHGSLKYISPVPGAEGQNSVTKFRGIDLGRRSVPQLYDLDIDIREENNLSEESPDRIVKMQSMIDEIKTRKQSARNKVSR